MLAADSVLPSFCHRSTSLLRLFFSNSLLDVRTLLTYLVNQLAASNLVQLGFLIQLVEQYEIDILGNAQLGRGMIDHACVKIKEVDGSLSPGSLRGIKVALVRMLQVRPLLDRCARSSLPIS
jgi:mediator of RNA polymerase II transcription subunit 12